MVSNMIDFEYILNRANCYVLSNDEIISLILGIINDDNNMIEEIRINGKQLKQVINWKKRIEG
jgi:hypothetical protein